MNNLIDWRLERHDRSLPQMEGVMTIAQAKKDAQARLAQHGITYQSMKGKTVDFGDLARGSAIFIEVYGVDFQAYPVGIGDAARDGIAKPSLGGYILKFR